MVNALDGYDDGAWWVQDSAASLPAMLLGDIKGKRVIDCCAAPGGKTAQIIASGAEVIALDQSAERMKILKANMTRLKMTPEIVVADGMTYETDGLVDAVLLDAPCSATGTIRRRPDILSHQNPPDLALLNRLQKGLLEQAATWLKPGGVLVYATCSILKDEGEAIIQSLPPSLNRWRSVMKMPQGLPSPEPIRMPSGSCLTRWPYRQKMHPLRKQTIKIWTEPAISRKVMMGFLSPSLLKFRGVYRA